MTTLSRAVFSVVASLRWLVGYYLVFSFLSLGFFLEPFGLECTSASGFWEILVFSVFNVLSLNWLYYTLFNTACQAILENSSKLDLCEVKFLGEILDIVLYIVYNGTMETKEIFREYQERIGMQNITKFAAHLEVSTPTLYSWLNGTRQPYKALSGLKDVLPLDVYRNILVALDFLPSDVLLTRKEL